jgi:hypothetical protein
MLCCLVLVVVSGAVGRSKVRDAKLAKTIADRLNLVLERMCLLNTSHYYPVTTMTGCLRYPILAKEIDNRVRSGLIETGCWVCTIEKSSTVRVACISLHGSVLNDRARWPVSLSFSIQCHLGISIHLSAAWVPSSRLETL